MPIILPKGLPARHALKAEGILLPSELSGRARGETLRIALLNLMPRKTVTEIQIARLLGGTTHTVDLTLAVPDSYISKTVPAFHLGAFYRRWSDIRNGCFDGLVVTGAPIEHLPFEEVTYWPELTQVFDWAARNRTPSYYICWAAQAALYHFHGVPKHPLPNKRFGVYGQTIRRTESPLFHGLGGTFPVPVSRHTETRREDLPRGAGLDVLADSLESGLCMVEDRERGALCMFNHLEYDADTLANEYRRDRDAGAEIAVPANYFPSDDPARQPVSTWQPHARRFFRNWLDGITPARDAVCAASGY